MSKTAVAAKKADAVLSELARVMNKKGDAIDASSVERWPIHRLPRLSKVMGGGVPRGRTIEIHGPLDAAKTTTMGEIMRACIDANRDELAKPDGRRLQVQDHEGVMDVPYMEKITGVRWGVMEKISDLPRLWPLYPVIYMVPPHFEFDARMTHFLMKRDRLLMSCHDSVAAMISRSSLEGKPGDDGEGREIFGADEDNNAQLMANLLSSWLPKWKKASLEGNCTIVWVNQAKKKTRGHIGFLPPPWYTLRGEAPVFYADIRIRCVGGKSDLHPFGRKARQTMIKNKTTGNSGCRNVQIISHVTGRDGYDAGYEWIKIAVNGGLLTWRNAQGVEVAPGSKAKSFLATADGSVSYTIQDATTSLMPGGDLHDTAVTILSGLEINDQESGGEQ